MRALTDDERAGRRNTLADQALELLAETGYGGLTVEAVARRARVAKGSVFLAFASKEDLVLHGAGRRIALWFGRLAAVTPSPKDPGAFAQDLLVTLRHDTLLLPLLSLVGPVLEHGCTPGAVVGFKEALAREAGRLADLWSARVPGVPTDTWLDLFRRVHALTVGAWAVSETSSTVRDILADRPDLQFLMTRFDDLFLGLAGAQIRALLDPRP